MMARRRLVRLWRWNEMSVFLHNARSIGKKGGRLEKGMRDESCM